MNNIPEDLRRAIAGSEIRALAGTTDPHDEMTELLTMYPVLQLLPFSKDHPLNLLTALKMDHPELIPRIYQWRRDNGYS